MIRFPRWGAPWLVALTLLAACSRTEASPPPQVASLPSASASPASTSTPPPSGESERPQLRLDTSKEEENRIWAAYTDCKAAHGAPVVMGGDQGKSPNEAAATKACANLLPLQPPELDQSRPDFQDRYRVYLRCLNDGGPNVEAIEPYGTGWNYTDRSPSDASELSQRLEKPCQLAAFRE